MYRFESQKLNLSWSIWWFSWWTSMFLQEKQSRTNRNISFATVNCFLFYLLRIASAFKRFKRVLYLYHSQSLSCCISDAAGGMKKKTSPTFFMSGEQTFPNFASFSLKLFHVINNFQKRESSQFDKSSFEDNQVLHDNFWINSMCNMPNRQNHWTLLHQWFWHCQKL